MSRPRVLFAIPTLHVGGAQRVFTNLLNGLAGRGAELHLAVVCSAGPYRDQLSPEITLHTMRGRRMLTALPQLAALIRRLNPEVVLTTAFRMNLGVMLIRPFLPRRTRFLMREVNVFRKQLPGGWRGSLLARLAAHAFRHADVIVCQSAFMANDLRQSLGIAPDRMRTILNPLCIADLDRKASGPNPYPSDAAGPHLLAVGRLSPEKGLDRLLTAVPALLTKRPLAQLWIVGEGAERAALMRQAVRLGIAPRVHFTGFQANPYPWMKHADLMVLPSRFEGTPNTVLEAIACECPLVALDHPGGTRELLRLTGQEERMVSDLSTWRDEWFAKPAPAARQRGLQLFSREMIVHQYLDAMGLSLQEDTDAVRSCIAA